MTLSYWIVRTALLLGICHGLKVPSVRLSNGRKMPIVGLGTFLMTSEQEDNALTAALQSGYRHIDTAFVYNNEKDIGNTLCKWFSNGGKRNDLFVTAKLPPQGLRASDVGTFLNISLNNLKLDYVDLFLIHVPFGFKEDSNHQYIQHKDGTVEVDYSTDLIAVWKEMEKQVVAGKTKAIGLSNFNKTQVMKIWKNAKIKPSNLQVETNAYLPEEELLKLCRSLGIVMTGYSPLGSGSLTVLSKNQTITLPSLLEHPVVKKIAERHNKSTAQVLLRFNLQRNIVVIPKSTNPKRLKENLDVFNFRLSRDDMSELKALNQHGKYRKFDFLNFEGIQQHPEYPFSDRVNK